MNTATDSTGRVMTVTVPVGRSADSVDAAQLRSHVSAPASLVFPRAAAQPCGRRIIRPDQNAQSAPSAPSRRLHHNRAVRIAKLRDCRQKVRDAVHDAADGNVDASRLEREGGGLNAPRQPATLTSIYGAAGGARPEPG